VSTQEFDNAALDERLQALKQSMEAMAAPDRVEAAVVAAFRRRDMRPVGRRWPRWALAAAAAVIVVAGAARLLNREPARQAPAPPVAVDQREAPAAVASAVPAPPPRRAPQRQAVQSFIPLVPDLTWAPGESAQVMRVSMPRSALQSFGLPVDETRAFEVVRADIIVGQDMVARAIRIVR
jgi:hypothetical protein